MDCGVVSGSQSDTTGGGGDKSPASCFAYNEKFKELFPFYLAIGMTYDEYWNGDCELTKYYRKAFNIKQELENQLAWLQGMYFYEALIDVSPALRAMGAKRPKSYPKEPYNCYRKEETKTAKKQKAQKNDTKAKQVMEIFAVNFNKKFEKKGGSSNGE